MFLLSHVCANFSDVACDLKFDDNEKQRKYETISFKEIHDELLELKVNSSLKEFL